MAPAEIVARARACVGARFRLHGRVPATGLDCVGLAAHAFAIADVPAGYRLRGRHEADIAAALARLGLRQAADTAPGTLLVLAAGPLQAHFAITAPGGFVHADAGLRRIVAVPGAPRWPVIGRWIGKG